MDCSILTIFIRVRSPAAVAALPGAVADAVAVVVGSKQIRAPRV